MHLDAGRKFYLAEAGEEGGEAVGLCDEGEERKAAFGDRQQRMRLAGSRIAVEED